MTRNIREGESDCAIVWENTATTTPVKAAVNIQKYARIEVTVGA